VGGISHLELGKLWLATQPGMAVGLCCLHFLVLGETNSGVFPILIRLRHVCFASLCIRGGTTLSMWLALLMTFEFSSYILAIWMCISNA